jgi:hypothetical protein
MGNNTKIDKKNAFAIRLFYFSLITIIAGMMFFQDLFVVFYFNWIYLVTLTTLASFVLMVKAFLKNKKENSNLIYYFPRQIAIISIGLLVFFSLFFQ